MQAVVIHIERVSASTHNLIGYCWLGRSNLFLLSQIRQLQNLDLSMLNGNIGKSRTLNPQVDSAKLRVS
jgi:hypothetical protein